MRRKLLELIFIFILSLPAIWYLLKPGYYSMHDDLQVMRIFQMEKCFDDGQIPCRWAPDMAWGYGQPLFNYYSAFPYYLGVFIRMVAPLSIIDTVKTLFALSLVTSGVGMYFLAKEFWGRWGGVAASVLYIYAPYHAVDIYVRGALSEAFALSILPFLFWSLYLLIKKPCFKKVIVCSFITFLLLTTHNVSNLMYTFFVAFWIIFWLIKFRNFKVIPYLFISGIIGTFMSSFFLLPAVLEQNLIQADFLVTDYLDYHAHFASLRQLFFDRFWGNGPSVFGLKDEMSFQIGWPHWWLGVIAGFFALFWLKEKKCKLKAILLALLLVLSAWCAFLTHSRSTPIWETVPKMSFIQFPWRFLGLTMFFLSLAGGAIFLKRSKPAKFLTISIIVLVVLLNITYFIPINYFPWVRDQEKLTGEAYEIQQKSAILDYLPKTAFVAPKEKAYEIARVILGEGKVENFTKSSNRFAFDLEVYRESKIEVPIMYFPNWMVLVDGQKVPLEISGDYGLIGFNVDPGKHIIQGRFLDTPIRSVGNMLSVFSISLVVCSVLIYQNRKVQTPKT